MSKASIRTGAGARPWNERLDPWFAALASALLHLLMLLALLHASVPVVATSQGAAAGGRTKVDFIGEARQPEQIAQPVPSPPMPRPSKPVRKLRSASPVRSTLVEHADNPLPPDTAATTDTPAMDLPAPAPREARASAASPPAPAQRRPETWTGRPPGLIEEDIADNDRGLARSPIDNRGSRRDPAAGDHSLEVGGYLVYYDLRNETRLRAWMDKGMKELSLPLPGTQYYMVCPLQVALDRGSGKCRLLAPDSPELKDIGDAREVINMLQVYRRGEPVWRGPGPYR
ncbi:MAG: type II toxin-antitoxin system RelE/ParE family toxin [Pseudoxanthomonas sp.]